MAGGKCVSYRIVIVDWMHQVMSAGSVVVHLISARRTIRYIAAFLTLVLVYYTCALMRCAHCCNAHLGR